MAEIKAKGLSSRDGADAGSRRWHRRRWCRGAALISAVAAASNEELVARLEEVFGAKAAAEGKIVVDLGELEQREAFRRRRGHLA